VLTEQRLQRRFRARPVIPRRQRRSRISLGRHFVARTSFVHDRCRRVIVHASTGFEDRAIAGATAEVAGDGFAHSGLAAAPALIEAGEGHDEARRAEAALRAMAFHHGGLHRVSSAPGLTAAIVARQPLDGKHLLTGDTAEERDTAVDDLWCLAGLGHQYRAGTAVAGSAALLGTAEPRLRAQETQQCLRGRAVPDCHRFAVDRQSRARQGVAPFEP
jgi:hypothetical protein